MSTASCTRVSAMLIAAALCFASSAMALDRYEPVEIALTATRTYANPYLDATITATVTPPAASGEAAYTIPGFWDGGQSWKVRWAPRHAGTYSVTVACSDTSDTGLHGRTFGGFNVSANYSPTWAPHGFVKVDPSRRHYLANDDGRKFYWIADLAWMALYEKTWFDHITITEAEFRYIADRRAEFGFNTIQTLIMSDLSESRWLDGNHAFQGDAGQDRDRINPISWQRVDSRVQYAMQKSLFMMLMTTDGGTHLGWPRAQRERFYRYLVARYAAYNVAFGGGDEINKLVDPDPAEYIHMIDQIHALDPYDHLVSMHNHNWGDVNRIVQIVPESVDIITLQSHNMNYFANSAFSRTYGKPFIFSEGDFFGNHADAVEIRLNAWWSFMGGAAGHSYGDDVITQDETAMTNGGSQEMKRFAAWIDQAGLRWWDYTRFVALGSNRFLAAAPGGQYIILASGTGGAFTVDLSDASGTLGGRWYDIANGTYGTPLTVTAGASVAIIPPGTWQVLRLDTTGANTAPTISDITDRSVDEGASTGAVAFTVGDAQTAAGSLGVSATSSNTALVPSANIVLAGSGANRTVTVTAAAGQTGSATITVTVSDGSLSASDAFLLTVTAQGPAVVSLNAGGPTIGPFAADRYATGGSTYTTAATIATGGVTNAAPAAVYQSERWGTMSYAIPGLGANTGHTVRLHFAEIYQNAAGARVFHVDINGARVLTGFDIFAQAGGRNIALVRDFAATANGSGTITIAFTSVTNFAKVSAIQILSSPTEVQQLTLGGAFNADVIVNRPAGGSIDAAQDGCDLYSMVTASAALALSANGTGLPDHGAFAANGDHPEVTLAYRNSDDGVNAIRLTGGGQAVTATLPAAERLAYSDVHLFFLGAAGSPGFTVTFTYADASTTVASGQVATDWFFAAPAGHYYLIDGLDRIDNSGSVLHDANNPAIFGKRFGLTPGKTLSSITITRDANASGNVIVFGATGVLATPAGPG
jgi:hypothetical protein